MRNLALLFVVFTVIEPSSARTETVLYDVDFGSPPNVLGFPPLLEFGPIPRHAPTGQFAGVVDSVLGGLSGQPLTLEPSSFSVGEVSFWLGPDINVRTGDPGLGERFSQYEVEMDAVVQVLLDSPLPGDDPGFKIEIQAPFPHQLRFTPDFFIRAITFDETGISETRIGSYSPGVPVHLRILADLTSRSWSVEIDGQHAFQGTFPNEGSVWDVQVELNRGSQIALAGIDNVRITGLPEPNVGILLAAGLYFLNRSLRLRRT